MNDVPDAPKYYQATIAGDRAYEAETGKLIGTIVRSKTDPKGWTGSARGAIRYVHVKKTNSGVDYYGKYKQGSDGKVWLRRVAASYFQKKGRTKAEWLAELKRRSAERCAAKERQRA